MKSKEFLKAAEACKESFFLGIKRVLGIKSPSPEQEPGFNEKFMQQATMEAMKANPKTTTLQPVTMADYEKVVAEIQSIPEERTPSPEVDDTLKKASLQIELTGYPAQEVAEALLRASESCLETTNSIDQLIAILRDFRGCTSMRRLAMESTNNWRRMHGIPMKRMTMQERRRKIKK